MQAFLSYAHSGPEREIVHPLARRLESAGIAVWTDDLVRAGDDWMRAIANALETSEVLLVLVSPNYWTSRACRSELEAMLSECARNPDKRIIPVLVQATEFVRNIPGTLHYIDGRSRTIPQLADMIAAQVHAGTRFAEAGAVAN